MIHEGGEIKISEDIPIGGINGLGNLASLFWILSDLSYLVNQYRIVAGILHRLVDPREDLRRIPHDQTPEELLIDLLAVGIDQLKRVRQLMSIRLVSHGGSGERWEQRKSSVTVAHSLF